MQGQQKLDGGGSLEGPQPQNRQLNAQEHDVRPRIGVALWCRLMWRQQIDGKRDTRLAGCNFEPMDPEPAHFEQVGDRGWCPGIKRTAACLQLHLIIADERGRTGQQR